MLWKEASKYAETRVRQREQSATFPSTTMEVSPRKRQEEPEQQEEIQTIGNSQMWQADNDRFIGEDDDAPLSF